MNNFFLKSSLMFLIFISSSSFADELTLDDIRNKISENTFLIVPINLYAPDLTVEEAREKYQAKCLKSDMAVHEKLNCEVLKSCEEGSCISEYANQGTAFLMNGGRELHTAWHVLFPTHAAGLVFASNYLESAPEEKKQKIYGNMKPSFVLLDLDYNIIYDTRVEIETSYVEVGDPLSTVFSNNGKTSKGVYGYIENIPDDFVKVGLTRSMGEGLKKAEPSLYGDLEGPFISAGFGFNAKTTTFTIETEGEPASLLEMKRKMKSFMEFTLHALSVPREDFWKMSPVDQLVLMGYNHESSLEQIAKYPLETIESSIKIVMRIQERNEKDLAIENHRSVIITTNSSLPGASGGPIMNSKGEVIGIITNGFSSVDKDKGVKTAHGSGAHLF